MSLFVDTGIFYAHHDRDTPRHDTALEAGEHELRPTGRETRSALGTERSTRVDCVRIHNYGFHPAKGAEYWYLDRHSPMDRSQTGSATCG